VNRSETAAIPANPELQSGASTGNRISHTFPAHSFTQLEIALKK
jgi:hypothetical protein